MSNGGPKGGSAKGKKNAEPLLPVGTRVLPKSGEPLPEGLSILSGRGIQMSFVWNGERCCERALIDEVDALAQLWRWKAQHER